MIRLIAFKDFYTNLISSRFIVGLLLCLVLIPFSIIINLNEYENTMRIYQIDKTEAEKKMKEVRVYSALRPQIVKPPDPMHIFCKGISQNIGNKVNIRLGDIPLFAEGNAATRDNPLLNAFLTFDFVTMLAILLALFAMLFSYDIIPREREDGTLKLIFTNQIKRGTFLLGKLIGSWLTLFPLLVICFLIAILFILFSPVVSFSGTDWVNIILIFIISILYAMFFTILAALISSLVRHSTQSIIIGLFAWTVFLFVIPNMAVYGSKNLVKTGIYDNLTSILNQLNDEMYNKRNEYQKELNEQGIQGGMWWNANGGDDGYFEVSGSPRTVMEFERRIKEYFEPVRIDYAGQKWQHQQGYLDGLYRQKKISRILACLSPSEIFKYSCSGLSHSDVYSYRQFMENTRIYREQFIKYLTDNKIFSSFKYVTPQPESTFLATVGDLYSLVSGGVVNSQEELQAWMKAHNGSWSILWKVPYPEGSMHNYPFLDVSDVPVFAYREPSTWASLENYVIPIVSMLLITSVMFVILQQLFVKYDIR